MSEPILAEPILAEPILAEPILAEPILADADADAEPILANYNSDQRYKQLIYILNASGIICNSMKELDGLSIHRDILMNDEKYKHLVDTDFALLKTIFSSSYLTSLQSTATSKQRFPLLNLVRQLIRSCNYKLTPKRLADGYTLSGVKKYKRMFIVEKMRL
jgi:hypothetical protein